MCDERESHSPPTDIDVRMMIHAFGVFGDATHGIDSVEEGAELDRAAKRTIGALPPVEILGGSVHLVIG